MEIIFNDGEAKITGGRKGKRDGAEDAIRKSGEGSRMKKRSRRGAAQESETTGVCDRLYSLWSVITFSWVRPLMVIGEDLRDCKMKSICHYDWYRSRLNLHNSYSTLSEHYSISALIIVHINGDRLADFENQIV